MHVSLYDRYLRVLHAKTLEEANHEAQGIIKEIGFKHYMYLFSLENRLTEEESCAELNIVRVGTYPKEWIDLYVSNKYYLIDPAAKHIKMHQHPLPWSNALFSEPDAVKMYAEAKSFGISAGASCPVLTAYKDVAGLGFAKEGDADECFGDVLKALPYGYLLTGYLHEAVIRILGLNPRDPSKDLTPRERECLLLMSKGLSDQEIAETMGVVLRTVRFHLKSCREKLGAQNRTQMLARAIELNIVPL